MALQTLMDNLDSQNLAKGMDDSLLAKLSRRVVSGFNIDDTSREEWKEQTEEGIKIAEQIVEEKTYPWPGASNVKFPLIAISAIQFAARAYPNIVQGDKVVKAQVIGEDPDNKKADRARRLSAHMSWQLLEEMLSWEEDTDKLLHCLPVVGTMFRKTYRDTLNEVNASELCMPLDVVVHMKTKSIDTTRRLTHIIPLYKNEVIERERSGQFVEKEASYMLQNDTEDLAENFLEQYCWFDLDEDGYEEPYIITVHQDSGTLVKMVPRYDEAGIETVGKTQKIKKITPIKHFTAYFFIPGASGKFYALGFAHLLGPINESINTTINQLLDAGHLANVQGGFLGRGIRLKAGAMRFKPGEWKTIDVTGGTIKDNIFPMPVKEPSGVLFTLLGMLNDTGMKLASVSETMAGESPSQNTPATTTLAVIEQGLKVFTAIYKRIYRSLKGEFKLIYRLNNLYLDEEQYFRVLDVQQRIGKEDYETIDFDIIPVADPTISSDAQRLGRVEALMGTYQLNPTPEGKLEILTQYYEGIQAARIDKLLPTEKIKQMLNAPPPPNPDVLKMGLETTKAQHEEERKRHILPFETQLLEAQISEIDARTAKLVAETLALPTMNSFAVLKQQVADMHKGAELEISREREQIKREAAEGVSNKTGQAGDNAGGRLAADGGMAPPPNNGEGAQLPLPMSEGAGAGAIGGADAELPISGEGGSPDDLSAGGDQGSQPYPEGTQR